jgi:hypothetical protein
MRKLLTVLASAAMVVGLGAPAWASDNAPSADQPITAMGKGGGHHGEHRGDRGDRGHQGDRHRGDRGDHGYRHGHRDYDDGYYRHHNRYRYGYDRSYYGGYYGCGYYPDCDPYYGGYDGGRRSYNDRSYYDRDYDRGCGYRGGSRYDSRCDCYHRDTRCDRSRDRYYDRGCDCYRTYGAEDPQTDANAPAAEPAPAPESAPVADSPSPQQQ